MFGMGDEELRTGPARSPFAAPRTGGVLATDAEREAAVEVVRRALADGSLTIEEAEERIGASYAARRRSELLGLLADLPQARSERRLPATRWIALAATLIVLAITAAIADRHGAFPLIPLAFILARSLWWRGRWHRTPLPLRAPPG
jgi:hypothetical protein